MGLEEPRLPLVRTNSIRQPCISELAILHVPVPQSAGADAVLIGEIACQRVHAPNGHSAEGTERWTGSPTAAAEVQQRSDRLQALPHLGVLFSRKVEALGFGDFRQRRKQRGLLYIGAQCQSLRCCSRQERV